MATIPKLLSLLVFYALSYCPTYSLSQFCYRLAPQQITAVATPCYYPCMPLSSYVQPIIHMQQEMDGAPCSIPGGHNHGHQVSRCMGGICLSPMASQALKRGKRGCLLVLAAKKIIGKVKEQVAVEAMAQPA
ncbi:uncharacterized protein LOC125758382 [Rhipicephalus sanguineus]|uniref:uncharacterized protein LOC125758382 n=1 Tax=Rhipicephalus sanguineus TaxID=34632 RepID=UPI0020C3723A|nr:uncharacterized protein LOC125758382 [Rhipicephalus sanguineus]